MHRTGKYLVEDKVRPPHGPSCANDTAAVKQQYQYIKIALEMGNGDMEYQLKNKHYSYSYSNIRARSDKYDVSSPMTYLRPWHATVLQVRKRDGKRLDRESSAVDCYSCG